MGRAGGRRGRVARGRSYIGSIECSWAAESMSDRASNCTSSPQQCPISWSRNWPTSLKRFIAASRLSLSAFSTPRFVAFHRGGSRTRGNRIRRFLDDRSWIGAAQRDPSGGLEHDYQRQRIATTGHRGSCLHSSTSGSSASRLLACFVTRTGPQSPRAVARARRVLAPSQRLGAHGGWG